MFLFPPQTQRERFNFLPWWSEQTLHRWWLHPLVNHRVWIYSSPARLHLSSSLLDHSLCPSTVQGPLGRTHEHGWERGSIYCIIFKTRWILTFFAYPELCWCVPDIYLCSDMSSSGRTILAELLYQPAKSAICPWFYSCFIVGYINLCIFKKKIQWSHEGHQSIVTFKLITALSLVCSTGLN